MTTTPISPPHHRSFFYVGGHYVEDGKGGQIMEGQIYVEELTPVVSEGQIKRPWPLVLIHGAGQTGTNWLQTPDHRPGWASHLLTQGYTLYIPDLPSRGRSPLSPSHTQSLTHYTTQLFSRRLTAPSHWPSQYPQARLHTQWPGSGLPGDPTFDAYFASTVPSLADYALEQTLMRDAGAALLDRVGPVVLLGHSQGAVHGWVIADARPGLVKGIVAVEPSGPPFESRLSADPRLQKGWGVADVPLGFEPVGGSGGEDGKLETEVHEEPSQHVLQTEPARRLANLSRIPVLVETGEASSHAPYDQFTVAFLRQAGVKVEHWRLEDFGIRGNGHMQMLEMNNMDVIAKLEEWIAKIE